MRLVRVYVYTHIFLNPSFALKGVASAAVLEVTATF